MYCSKCGNEVMDEAVVCINCGCAVNANTNIAVNKAASEGDKASVGLVILSVLFPIIGLILYCVKNKETPDAAKKYGLAALISWLVGIFFYLMLFIINGSIYF